MRKDVDYALKNMLASIEHATGVDLDDRIRISDYADQKPKRYVLEDTALGFMLPPPLAPNMTHKELVQSLNLVGEIFQLISPLIDW